MRIANQADRLCLVDGDQVVDVAAASAGRFSSDPHEVFDQWDAFRSWADGPQARRPTGRRDAGLLGPPSPRPRQVFGVGINYAEHAREVDRVLPEAPLIFTKFPTCITGPGAVVTVSGPRVDWEVELVAVIGRQASRVSAEKAWDYVAGLTIGQDLSDRDVQYRPGSVPQFSLGKSLPGFGPIGPELVTVDEFGDPDDLGLGCSVNGVEVQRSRTGNLILGVPQLIEYLSSLVPLVPGDLLFTGTPAGVGKAMDPPRFLAPGDVVTSWVEGIGEMITKMG